MRKTYRIDLRHPDRSHPSEPVKPRPWVQHTRVNTKQQAENQADMWRARGFEVVIVEER